MPAAHATPGPLVVIGGAEDKLGTRTILSRFVQLAGRKAARIVVLSTASALGDAATLAYKQLFAEMGVTDVRGLRPLTRAESNDPATAAVLDDATALFMTGGNQLRLSAVVSGTLLGQAIQALHARGGVIAGTSAGASVQGELMPSFGAAGTTPKQRMVQLSAGLGLLRGAIVDQHFEQRNRIGRLLALVVSSPSHLGLGIDEDTAIVVTGSTMEVLGRGAVTVIDGAHAESDAYEVKGTRPLLVSGVILHSLPSGTRFDLAERRLLPALRAIRADPEPIPLEPVRRLVDRIAAEGADDAVVARNARRRARRGSSAD